ncbi:unnamed protein product [Linum trigynum]|uniref:Uncharacterized protein n=1 Tax=Linum trigynum TaxID=586398 RepID=A0AAV2FTV1_9ROSI
METKTASIQERDHQNWLSPLLVSGRVLCRSVRHAWIDENGSLEVYFEVEVLDYTMVHLGAQFQVQKTIFKAFQNGMVKLEIYQEMTKAEGMSELATLRVNLEEVAANQVTRSYEESKDRTKAAEL